MKESRVKKSLLNAQINLLFYFLLLILTFFSRKIFLNSLGADFVGLTGTLQNILGFLNLAELGIGAAISFNLYKPIADGDKNKINDLISIFGYLYNRIGLLIILAAILLSCFIPIIFNHTIFEYGIIYFAFYSFLFSSLLGYFVNYKQILLTADQKNYVVASYFQTANILKCIIQMGMAYYFTNYYVWIVIEIAFSIIYSLILSWKINKEYPWLQPNIKQGRSLNKKYPEIINYTKQIFVHKLKDFLLGQSDQIMIFAFVSLKMVAYYGNYTMIIFKLTQLFNTTMDSIGAGVGNLIAEGNRLKAMKVFWELMSIRYFIAGLIVFSMHEFIDPFISIWLGKEYLLDRSVLILLLINVFIMQTRGVVDMFNGAYGLYGDTWSAWAEGIINIAVTLIAGSYWGIAGILLGKIISTLGIIVFWKPYYLFSNGLKESYGMYWNGTIRYYLIFILSFWIGDSFKQFLELKESIDLLSLIYNGTILITIFASVYLLFMFLFTPGMKDLLKRIPVPKQISKYV